MEQQQYLEFGGGKELRIKIKLGCWFLVYHHINWANFSIFCLKQKNPINGEKEKKKLSFAIRVPVPTDKGQKWGTSRLTYQLL